MNIIIIIIMKGVEVKADIMSWSLSARIRRSMKNLKIIGVPCKIRNYILPDRRQSRYRSGRFV
jgi:hypothetical protein